MDTTIKGMVWKGQCTAGRVSYLGRVDHTQVTYANKPNLPTSQTFIIDYPNHQPYFGYPGWESGTLSRQQPNPTLVTFISLPSLPYLSTLPSLPFPTLPYLKEIPYPINSWKNTLPYLECLFSLPYLYPPYTPLPTLHYLYYIPC